MEVLADYQRRALGSILKAARLRLGWKQAEAGKRGGLDRAYLSHIERGKKSPSLAALIRYCAAMDVNLCDVLVESGLVTAS